MSNPDHQDKSLSRRGEGVSPVPSPAGGPVPNPAVNSPRTYSPDPNRTSAQIREDIDSQRAELGKSVDQLRDKVTEITDWRGQIRKHRKQIVVGAVAVGFVVGGLAALRRRR